MNALNIQEVAAHLKVHPKTAEKMARDGVIPAAKIGRAYVVMMEDLDRFMRDRIREQTKARRSAS